MPLVCLLALSTTSLQGVSGQNVTGYESMPNPYLLLLREPAVQDELGLSRQQRTALQELNTEIDGPLLALRNWPPERATAKLTELIDKTRRQVENLFNQEQRERMEEIVLRVRGIRLVLVPGVADRLRLSDQQKRAIQETLDVTSGRLEELRSRLRNGESREQIEALAREARESEQTRILEALSDEQRRGLYQVVGRPFDVSRLGQVAFRAPELQDSGGWINSQPLRLEDLRGRVVAVHFWAFG
jgi:hypothetical protein